jgi:hypothetical protein
MNMKFLKLNKLAKLLNAIKKESPIADTVSVVFRDAALLKEQADLTI